MPQTGWALITREAPRDTLGGNFTEQNQSLRIMGPSIGLPSHMVRRRTLVEAAFDLVVGRLLLSEPLQQRTLDWTSSGTSKRGSVCIYLSKYGIRIRELPRSTRHSALGFCPNW